MSQSHKASSARMSIAYKSLGDVDGNVEQE